MKFGSVHFDEQSKKLKQPASDRPTKLDDSKKNRMNISNDFIGMRGYPGYIYIYIYIIDYHCISIYMAPVWDNRFGGLFEVCCMAVQPTSNIFLPVPGMIISNSMGKKQLQ